MGVPEPTDPDDLALLLVQQYLSENGHAEVLLALEKKSGVIYDDEKVSSGSLLMQLVYHHLESASAEHDDPEAAALKLEEEALLRGGLSDYVSECSTVVEGVHTASVVAVRMWPGRDQILSGAGDGSVALCDFSGNVEWRVYVGSGGVLSIDLHPHFSSGTTLLAVGSMDGSLSILQARTGQLMATERVHVKYLTRVAWSKDGRHIATCSHDRSVGIHSVRLSVAGEDGSANDATAAGDIASEEKAAMQEGLVVTLSTVHKVPYSDTVSDVCFMSDGVTLVVAIRGSCFLRLLDSCRPSEAERQVNMNEQDTDTHLSFSASQLALSHCGHYLLVSTDSPRILIFATHSWKRLRVMYGPAAPDFHIPATAWHRDPNYVYAAAAGGTCIVFHVGSGKQVSTLPQPHRANVRSMHYDAERNLLTTCSFDKAIKVYGHPTPV